MPNKHRRTFSGKFEFYVLTKKPCNNNLLKSTTRKCRERSFKNIEIVARFDRNKRHILITKSIERYTSIPAAHFLGKTNEELGMSADSCRQWNGAIDKVFETAAPFNLAFSFPTKDGISFFFSNLMPEFDGDKVISVLVIVQKVDSVNTYKYSPQEQVVEVITAMMNDGILNPAAVIKGYIDFIMYKKLVNSDILSSLKASNDEIIRVVKRFSLLNPKRYVEQKPTNIAKLIEAMLPEFRTYASEFSQKVVFLPYRLIPDIYVSEEEMGHLIRELVFNAIEANPPNHYVGIALIKNRTELILSVIDSGSGLENLDKPFRLFHSSKDRYRGIGLNIALSIINAHNLSWKINSKPSSGTIIEICIPLFQSMSRTSSTALLG